MAVLTAVVGIGQTKYEAKRLDVSMPGLIREAAERALADAGCSWRDIDAVRSLGIERPARSANGAL